MTQRQLVFTMICNAVLAILLLGISSSSADEARPDRGLELFQHCVRCHTISPDGENRHAPNLHGLLERGMAATDDFEYSKALKRKKNEEGYWTLKSLNAFLAKPHMAVPGTDTTFIGLLNPHDRKDLLTWIIQASRDPNLPQSIDIPVIGSMGDPERGQILFRPCKACHSYEKGELHEVGPNLFGLLGRPIASAEGFNYSEHLSIREGKWTPENLNHFLLEKKEFRPGTHVAFKTLLGPLDREDLIAYLATLKE